MARIFLSRFGENKGNAVRLFSNCGGLAHPEKRCVREALCRSSAVSVLRLDERMGWMDRGKVCVCLRCVCVCVSEPPVRYAFALREGFASPRVVACASQPPGVCAIVQSGTRC